MAYSTGSYTDINDALDKAAAWAVTNGWTQNMNTLEGGTNRRVHLSKTIGGVSVYSNFKAFFNTKPFSVSSYTYDAVTGIAVIGSTGYDAGLGWNAQPGATTFAGNSAYKAGGCVDLINNTAGGTYHFFATATTLTCWFETTVASADWRGFTIGVTSKGCPFYMASGGADKDNYGYGYRSIILATTSVANNSCAFLDGATWYRPITNTYNVHGFSYPAGGPGNKLGTSSPEGAIIDYAPESIRGNMVLAPLRPCVAKAISTERWPVGEIEGIKVCNGKNYADGSEISIGSDTYMLFRQSRITTYPQYAAWAFLK